MTALTIVIPVYNRAGIVGRTLESIEAQSWRPLNVVLVDNGSTDGTYGVLSRWKDSCKASGINVTLVKEPIPGAAAARNRGLMEVSTPWVMHFDSDDAMRPGHIERIEKAIAGNPTAGIIGWDVMVHRNDGDHRYGFKANDALYNALFHGTMATLRWAATVKLVRGAGMWNPDVKGWDDSELGIRMLALKPKAIYLRNHIGADVYASSESITGTGYAICASRWEHSLDCMENSIPGLRWRRRVNLMRAILAGLYMREECPEAANLLIGKVMASEKSTRYRTLYNISYRMTSSGHRGAARLMRPFF